MHLYEPREDSFLLQKQISEYAKGAVLDICTGTGILAEEAAKTAEQVIAADINPEAIDYCKKHIKQKNIKFVASNLFENIKHKFDLIIINPPYLPNDPRIKDAALDGGKHGYEFIRRFLKRARQYLKADGKILLLFSSLTDKDKVGEIIKENRLRYKQISSLKLDFEELFVYIISIR